MMCSVKAGIMGGIVLFIWGMVSWTVLPWHMMTIHGFKSDVAVSQSIQANAPVSGVYVLPAAANSDVTASNTQGPQPMVFASVRLEGVPTTMTTQMLTGLLMQIVVATLVAFILGKTKLGYLGKVMLVVVFALAAAIISNVPAWNWMGFDTNYTLVMMADTLISWTLAGLVLARFAKSA